MKPSLFTGLAAAALCLAAGAAHAQVDPLQVRSWAAACASCHSPNGSGIPAQYPRLSGQHADYTVKSLTDFRDGKRSNSIPMAQVAAKLNDREIKAVADYIAGLR